MLDYSAVVTRVATATSWFTTGVAWIWKIQVRKSEKYWLETLRNMVDRWLAALAGRGHHWVALVASHCRTLSCTLGGNPLKWETVKKETKLCFLLIGACPQLYHSQSSPTMFSGSQFEILTSWFVSTNTLRQIHYPDVFIYFRNMKYSEIIANFLRFPNIQYSQIFLNILKYWKEYSGPTSPPTTLPSSNGVAPASRFGGGAGSSPEIFFSPPLKIKRSWGWPKVLWKTRRTRKHGRGGGVTQNGRTNHAFWHLKDYCVSWFLSLSNYQYLVVLNSKYVIVFFLKDGWWGAKKKI